MPLTWTIAIAEKLLGYSFYASGANIAFVHNEIDHFFQIGCLAVFRHASNGLLDEINIAIRKGHQLVNKLGVLHCY